MSYESQFSEFVHEGWDCNSIVTRSGFSREHVCGPTFCSAAVTKEWIDLANIWITASARTAAEPAHKHAVTLLKEMLEPLESRWWLPPVGTDPQKAAQIAIAAACLAHSIHMAWQGKKVLWNPASISVRPGPKFPYMPWPGTPFLPDADDIKEFLMPAVGPLAIGAALLLFFALRRRS